MALFKGDIYSYSLDKMTPIMVYLPQDDNRRFLVNNSQRTLILLHGAEGNYSYWSRYTSIERYAQKKNLAVIMPDAGLSMYADMKNGQNYEEYIAIEIKNILGSMFRLNLEREHISIAGLSMGGYGALKIALKYPEQFGRCAAFSGAFILGESDYLSRLSQWEDPGPPEQYDEFYELDKTLYKACRAAYGEDLEYAKKNDVVYLAEKVVEENKVVPEILLTCGTEDFLYHNNCMFSRYLHEIGVKHEFHEWPGVHNWDFWEECIKKHMSFFV
ncbi:MAG: hypothetical protein CSA26_08290 [Desulfobacterales bacterium]|nr:MAG: hypothetical protein CSA26_08290 [Desulfobacterales bacterium]